MEVGTSGEVGSVAPLAGLHRSTHPRAPPVHKWQRPPARLGWRQERRLLVAPGVSSAPCGGGRVLRAHGTMAAAPEACPRACCSSAFCKS